MQKLQSFVEAGNTTLAITGAAGTISRKVQGSFPSATVTVYLAGTVTIASIYSDNALTPKANPFTASTDGTWFCYAANGLYDVNFSGGGIAAPFTLGALGNGTIATYLGSAYVSAGDFSGADAGAKITNAIAALPVAGGIVNAIGLSGAQTISTTVTIPANVTVLLGPSSYSTTVQAFNLTGNGARLIGLGSGQDGIGTDITPTAPTVITASGLGGSVDLIRAASTSRGSLLAAKLVDIEIRGICIDMAGVGRRGVYATTTNNSKYDDIKIWNGVENGFVLDGGLSTDSVGPAAYKNWFRQVQVQLIAANVTGAGMLLDATYGEISYTEFFQCRFSGNIASGGGKISLHLLAGASTNDSLGHTTISNCYIGNPSSVAGSYGLRLSAGGTYSSQSGGRIFDLTIKDTLVERLFASALGVGIGGTDASGTATGTGIGSVVLDNSGASAHWATSIDRANMGQTYSEISGNTNPGAGQPTLRVSGTTFGANSVGLYFDETMNAGANNDTLYGINTSLSVSVNGKTGITTYGVNLDWASATGTPSVATTLRIAGPTFGSTNRALHVATGNSRFDSKLGIGGDPITPLDVSEAVSGDNAIVHYAHPTLTSTAGAQTQTVEYMAPSFATAASNPALVRGKLIDMGSAISGGGTAVLAIGLDVTPPVSGATTSIAIRAQGGIQMNPNFARPTASAAYRNTIWVVPGGAGVADIIYFCIKDATDTYVWKIITLT